MKGTAGEIGEYKCAYIYDTLEKRMSLTVLRKLKLNDNKAQKLHNDLIAD